MLSIGFGFKPKIEFGVTRRIVFSTILRIMFASKCGRVLRGVRGNVLVLGKNACFRPTPTLCSVNPSFRVYRAFSNVVDEGKKAVEGEKAVKDAAQQVVQKPPVSRVRQTVAGLCIGFAASALGSMVGLGGGFIIIPLLTSIGGMTQHQASACSLASIFVNSITGTSTYISQGLVDLPAAAVITATSMFMSRYGSRWSRNFESKTLKKYYGWMCLIVAPLIPLKNYIMNKKKEEEAQAAAQVVEDDLAAENAKFGYRDCLSKDALKKSEAVEHSPLLLTLGLVAGTMSGFFGVGGGIIVSPSLCLFTKMAGKKIMGTSLVRVAPCSHL